MTALKILVLSDSHRTMRYMIQAVEEEQPDHVIHLGDHCSDAEALSRQFQMLPVMCIRGNCDLDPTCREQILTEFGGVRILSAHGHRYGVKSGLLRYALAAKESLAEIALFGHTHQAFCEEYEGITLLNPGSCGYGRPSYGIIEIHDQRAACHIKYIQD